MLYKITAADGAPVHGGSGKWPLPTDKPGRWRSVRGELVACERGLHLVDEEHLPPWVTLDAVVWEAETQGPVIDAGDKHVARKARLTRKVGVLTRELLVEWACDCAERVLPIFEKKHPKDDRPRKAIETTRAWLRGEASSEQVRDARQAAAYVAYAASAYAASASASAYASASASAYASASASASASAAAASVAAEAAYSAAAARQEERRWQGAHLMELLRR